MTITELIQTRDGEFLSLDQREKELAEPKLKRVFGSTAIFTSPSSTFADTNKEYSVFISFKDFYATAEEQKLSLSNAINYSICFENVKISSTDPSDVFWGKRYNATQKDSGYFEETRDPTVRNPEHRSSVSKHSLNILYWIVDNQDVLESLFQNYYHVIDSPTLKDRVSQDNDFFAMSAEDLKAQQVSQKDDNGIDEIDLDFPISEEELPDEESYDMLADDEYPSMDVYQEESVPDYEELQQPVSQDMQLEQDMPLQDDYSQEEPLELNEPSDLESDNLQPDNSPDQDPGGIADLI